MFQWLQNKALESITHDAKKILWMSSAIASVNPNYMWLSVMYISSGGRRPKKKVYYRVPELDKAIDMQKKPALILRLKSIIQSQKDQALLLRDLEKEVGFIRKWNYMAIIEKYPSIFYVTEAGRRPAMVMLTQKAGKIAALETEAKEQMEPILVKNLRKLLMLSVECRVPLETIEKIGVELGLPTDFKNSLIRKYPQFFSVKGIDGREYLSLEQWDSSLTVTVREERLACNEFLDQGSNLKKARISKDGNFPGRCAFPMNFPAGFRPNMSYLDELQKWQKMEFPSPYLNARRFEVDDPKFRKRLVAVLHELLSLTMEKRLTFGQLDAFHYEYRLPPKLLLFLIKHHGIFYLTNKGAKSTVILKEAYDGYNLVDLCPLLAFRKRFVSLIGARDIGTCPQVLKSRDTS